MADRITIKIEGGEELRRKLNELGEAMAGAALRRAGEAGAKVLQSAANRRAPGPHIETEVVEAGADSVTVAIGPDKDHFYYQFFETGAAAHDIKGRPLLVFEGREGTVFTPGVKHPGMGARPFLRPAIDEQGDAAAKAAAEALRAEVQRVVRK